MYNLDNLEIPHPTDPMKPAPRTQPFAQYPFSKPHPPHKHSQPGASKMSAHNHHYLASANNPEKYIVMSDDEEDCIREESEENKHNYKLYRDAASSNSNKHHAAHQNHQNYIRKHSEVAAAVDPSHNICSGSAVFMKSAGKKHSKEQRQNNSNLQATSLSKSKGKGSKQYKKCNTHTNIVLMSHPNHHHTLSQLKSAELKSGESTKRKKNKDGSTFLNSSSNHNKSSSKNRRLSLSQQKRQTLDLADFQKLLKKKIKHLQEELGFYQGSFQKLSDLADAFENYSEDMDGLDFRAAAKLVRTTIDEQVKPLLPCVAKLVNTVVNVLTQHKSTSHSPKLDASPIPAANVQNHLQSDMTTKKSTMAMNVYRKEAIERHDETAQAIKQDIAKLQSQLEELKGEKVSLVGSIDQKIRQLREKAQEQGQYLRELERMESEMSSVQSGGGGNTNCASSTIPITAVFKYHQQIGGIKNATKNNQEVLQHLPSTSMSKTQVAP